MSESPRAHLARLVLQRCHTLGHVIPRITWEPSGSEGIGTCTRCGDGVLVYMDDSGCEIGGTAYDSECPGLACEHGWRVIRREGGVVLRCLHCGAERSEGPS